MTRTVNFYSLEQQDEFIANLFNFQTNGTFIDVACGHPMIANNTYSLEKEFNWNGFCFEYNDVSRSSYVKESDGRMYHMLWPEERQARLVQIDATSEQFRDFLKDNIDKDQVIDYISLDVDAAGQNFALITLKRILEAGVRFKAMTFEHEIYSNKEIQPESRRILESLGYKRLFSDIRLWEGGIHDDSGRYSEDWWIDPKYFDDDILTIAQSKQYYFDCIKTLTEYRKLDYKAHHHCCQAFKHESDLWDVHSYFHHAMRNPAWKSAWE